MEQKMENDIRNIVRNEMEVCFREIQSDVSETKADTKEIKRALLGDEEYQNKGIIKQVRENTEYIEHNKTLDVAAKGMKIIEWFDMDGRNDKSKPLDSLLTDYSRIKWLLGTLIATGAINITIIVKWVFELITAS